MNPETALWIILTITFFSVCAGAPLAIQFKAEMKRARANLDGYRGLSVALLLLGWVTLGLWWYVGVSIDRPLLGVIPTVTAVSGAIVRRVIGWNKAEA